MEMGHGDKIVLADANFPVVSNAKHVIRADGHSIPELLDAILSLMPLDDYIEKPTCVMEPIAANQIPEVWSQYETIINKHEKFKGWEYKERFAFYEEAKTCFAIVATSERALKANVILTKGVIRQA
jgi:L-fucose mutarotase